MGYTKDLREADRPFLERHALDVFILLCVAAFGLLAHGYRLFNAMYSHDSLLLYSDAGDDHWQISLGRFLQPAYRIVRGNINAPALLNALALAYVGLSACLTSRLLRLTSRVHAALMCGVMTVNVAFTLTNATYLPWLDIFMFSLLLNVAAAYLFDRFRYGFLAGAALIAVSLALYQGYYQAATILMMITLVQRVIDGERFKAVLTRGLKALLCLGLGMGLYYAGTRLASALTGVAPTDAYNGIGDVFNVTGGSVAALALGAYKEYVKILGAYTFPSMNPYLSAALVLLMALVALYALFRTLRAARVKGLEAALAAVIVALMPLGMNSIYVISKGMTHQLMMYAIFFTYAFAMVICEAFSRRADGAAGRLPGAARACSRALAAFLTLMIFSNVVYANQVYLKKDLDLQNTHVVAGRLLERIERTDGYEMNKTPVAFVGMFSDSVFSVDRAHMADLHGVGVYRGKSLSLDYSYQAEQYFEGLLGYPINCVGAETVRSLSRLDEVRAMPAFPDQDSLRMVDGVLVVKMSPIDDDRL